MEKAPRACARGRAARHEARPCRFGLATPVVTHHPRHGAAWEATPAGGAGAHRPVRPIGSATITPHVQRARPAIPACRGPDPGHTALLRPVATFGFLRGTRRHESDSPPTCSCCRNPTRSPSPNATARSNRLSGGRLILGVGVGRLRRSRAAGCGPSTPAASAMRTPPARCALPSAGGAAYAAHALRFGGFVVDPSGVQPQVPTGSADGARARSGARSPRRGSARSGLTRDELARLLPAARGWREWREARGAVRAGADARPAPRPDGARTSASRARGRSSERSGCRCDHREPPLPDRSLEALPRAARGVAAGIA